MIQRGFFVGLLFGAVFLQVVFSEEAKSVDERHELDSTSVRVVRSVPYGFDKTKWQSYLPGPLPISPFQLQPYKKRTTRRPTPQTRPTTRRSTPNTKSPTRRPKPHTIPAYNVSNAYTRPTTRRPKPPHNITNHKAIAFHHPHKRPFPFSHERKQKVVQGSSVQQEKGHWPRPQPRNQPRPEGPLDYYEDCTANLNGGTFRSSRSGKKGNWPTPWPQAYGPLDYYCPQDPGNFRSSGSGKKGNWPTPRPNQRSGQVQHKHSQQEHHQPHQQQHHY